MSTQLTLARKIAKFQGVDWDFNGALSSYGLHRFHWYPGTFIPQIPAYLIELFSQPGDLVLDPFCGVGTTLVEALRLGRRAVGADVNHIATLVASVKVCFVDSGKTTTRMREFLEQLNAERGDLQPLPGSPLFRKRVPSRLIMMAETYRHAAPWYHPDTFYELLLIWEMIQTEKTSFSRVLTVAFSQILKRCSSQKHHWGYVADNMQPKLLAYVDAVSAFEDEMSHLVEALTAFRESPAFKSFTTNELVSRAKVVQADLRRGPVVGPEEADVVVTSPPYVNVTDYTTSQRLSLAWFGLDPDELKALEIGARWKRFRKRAVQEYTDEMDVAFGNIIPSLKRGGFCCVVVGDATHKTVRVSVVELFDSLLSRHACSRIAPAIKRTLSRQRVVNRKGLSNPEYILVFRKGMSS